MAPIRLALLICDIPIPAVVEKYGDYYAIYKKYLEDTLPASAPRDAFVLDPFDVVHKQEYPTNDAEYAGVILTGSAASTYEDLPWINKLIAYVASLITQKPSVKVFGICFGHQIVAHAFGEFCVRNEAGWEVGVTSLQLTPLGRSLFGVDSLNIQQTHNDHVPCVPAGFHLLGSTPVSMNQGMVRYADADGELQVLTIQGHPEFTAGIVRTMIDMRLASIISGDTAEDGRKRAEWRNDGVGVVGPVIWRMLGVGAA